ncbi:uncharacterized protein LOC100374884 [Saccoglossus kowalevskii]|uniref:Uncharacterized protein LOC100374884 n=1 Tax=Saccoglossus kowalevskii TaxID=10224 RepID=A0ABM0GUH2_SACKO|nr:PREDICTED: uncharacterized protein LOC100374884 [Saccoglossus kowalevskii]
MHKEQWILIAIGFVVVFYEADIYMNVSALECFECEYVMTSYDIDSECILMPNASSDSIEETNCDGLCYTEYTKIFGRPILFRRGCSDDCEEESTCDKFTGTCRSCCNTTDLCNSNQYTTKDLVNLENI